MRSPPPRRKCPTQIQGLNNAAVGLKALGHVSFFKGLEEANAAFTVASALMSPEMLEQALLYPKQSVELDMSFKNIMSVNVPRYAFHTKNEDPAEIYPYGFAQTSGELDAALDALANGCAGRSPKTASSARPAYP